MENKVRIYEDIIDQNIPMSEMSPEVFDNLLEGGWRLLGKTIVRHNFAVCRGQLCQTIPLRIHLRAFQFSKSQRKLLRAKDHFRIERKEILLTPEKEALFLKHTKRFSERQPKGIEVFLGKNCNVEPVRGEELTVYKDNEMLACSFMHLGEKNMSGTYCFFDPDYSGVSLGSLTMLLELKYAIELGMEYYYHGYCYDIPSQFDYKCNFMALQQRDWKTDRWSSKDRIPPRNWREDLE